MTLYNSLMKATNAVGGNIQAFYHGKDADRLRVEDEDYPDAVCGCGRMVFIKELNANGGVCGHCAQCEDIT